jgi:hypothetical protein
MIFTETLTGSDVITPAIKWSVCAFNQTHTRMLFILGVRLGHFVADQLSDIALPTTVFANAPVKINRGIFSFVIS